jgi:DHA2 family multidrug resistance protein
MGALVFGWSMWQHSLFTNESGWDDYLWPMVLRGVGLGLVFIPLNNLALGNLPPQQVAAGRGIYNLMRQLGGSVGIATSATLFVQFQQSNRGELLRHVSQFSDVSLLRLAKLKAMLISHGTPELLAQTKALWLMDGIVRKQAAMLAFERLFLGFGLMLIIALPLLLLMKRGRFMRRGHRRITE